MPAISELQEFGKDLWVVEGPLVRDAGVWFTTRMTIARLPDGSIWVESPVPAAFETLRRINELGPVQWLLAATPRHVWRLNTWHTLFPEAQLWTSPRTLFTLQQGSLHLTGTLGDQPPQAWGDAFEQLVFRGNPLLDEVVYLHKPSKTVIMGDMIQFNTPQEGHPLQDAIFKLGGIAPGQAGMGLDMRLTFLDRGAARRSLHRLLAWDFDKLIIAHGPCVEKDAKRFVEQAFQWLAP
ncbi:MAG: DUF4336 domain-containing protein [Bacteroidota bacterium]